MGAIVDGAHDSDFAMPKIELVSILAATTCTTPPSQPSPIFMGEGADFLQFEDKSHQLRNTTLSSLLHPKTMRQRGEATVSDFFRVRLCGLAYFTADIRIAFGKFRREVTK